MSTTTTSAGLLASKWATKPAETIARKTSSSSILSSSSSSSTGLLDSKWTPKPAENAARKNSSSSTSSSSSTGLLNSRWAPKSTTADQPVTASNALIKSQPINAEIKSTTADQPTAASNAPKESQPITAEIESTTASLNLVPASAEPKLANQPEPVLADGEWTVSSGPETASKSTPPKQIADSECAREPLLELLPASTTQPYSKKSWADLVDEDDDDFTLEFSAINKENFPSPPAAITEPTTNVPSDAKENSPPQPAAITEAAATVQSDAKENHHPEPIDTKENEARRPESPAHTTAALSPPPQQQQEQPQQNRKAPVSLLASRWSDDSYEIKGAQTRAEYRATHGSTSNSADRSSRRRRRAH